MNAVPTLETLGEFRLLKEIVLPLFPTNDRVLSSGDDCAFVTSPGVEYTTVVTTDAAPQSLAWSLGVSAYRSWGWYAVLVNASDLASAGADPHVLTTSVEAPSEMPVQDFRAFFEGIAAACKEFDLRNAGGNIRSAPRFACHGTAIGYSRRSLGRHGCRAGDLIVAVGECGKYISTYLDAKRRGVDALGEDGLHRLLYPLPRLREMKELHSRELVSAASDNSDGVLGSLWNIAESSDCAIELDMGTPESIDSFVLQTAEVEKVNPWNVAFFWGDWQIIAAIRSDREVDFYNAARQMNMTYSILGRAIPGPPTLFGMVGGKRRKLSLIRNENFIETSYNADIDSNIEYMLRAPLFI